MKRSYVICTVSVFLLATIISISSANATMSNMTLLGNPGTFLNIAANNTINVSVFARSENITAVKFSFRTLGQTQFEGDFFIEGTNGTSATAVSFANVSSGALSYEVNLTFSNISSKGIISNQTAQNFWFTLAGRKFSQALLEVNVTATGISGLSNSTFYSFSMAFEFTGNILNETGCATCFQNDTNVTIYGISNNANGPPSITALASSYTNNSGFFRLRNVNNSASFRGYRIKTIYYNGSNSSANAVKVGSIMPDFPSMMFYSTGEGSFDMTLNGGTFYLQPATTIKLKANNGTTPVSYGYEVVDQDLGFPIESDVQNKNINVTVVVPANRGYTISFFRIPLFPGSTIGYQMNETKCTTTDYMNDTWCPAPPKSATVTSVQATSGAVITINQSLVVRRAYVHGCINPLDGANNSQINVTNVGVKMIPWSLAKGSFVPPRNGNDGLINLSSQVQFNTTYPGCLVYYNVSLLNNTGYLLEIYAKNASHGTDAGHPGNAFNLAGWKNLTAVDGRQENVTLYRLIGFYRGMNETKLVINTSAIKINVINSSGHPVTSGIDANFKIKNTVAGVGTLYYMIDRESVANGSFYLPVLNNSNHVKIMIFSSNGPPKEKILNLSKSEINITIVSMSHDKGFRKFNETGGLQEIDTAAMPINMRFLKNDPECDKPFAPASICTITEMNATSFNPLKAMLAGKVNMEIKITSTNVSLIFHDYDMLSAKQPPMESVLEENASARTGTTGTAAVEERWDFGSFAPADSYANVTIVIPFSDTTSAKNYLNDSNSINISVPVLYDGENKMVWNASSGDTVHNLSEEFIAYNNTFYDDLLNLSGFSCSTSDDEAVCFVNTTGNYIAFKVPHFSTINAAVLGTATVTQAGGSGSTGTGSSTGGSGGATSNTTSDGEWIKTYAQNATELGSHGALATSLREKERVSIKVNGENHYVGVKKLSSALKVTVIVSSTRQEAVINMNDTAKFDLNADSYYDIGIMLTDVMFGKAYLNITYMKEKYDLPSSGETARDNESANETKSGDGSLRGISSLGKSKKLPIIIIIVLVIAVGLGIGIWRSVKARPAHRKESLY